MFLENRAWCFWKIDVFGKCFWKIDWGPFQHQAESFLTRLLKITLFRTTQSQIPFEFFRRIFSPKNSGLKIDPASGVIFVYIQKSFAFRRNCNFGLFNDMNTVIVTVWIEEKRIFLFPWMKIWTSRSRSTYFKQTCQVVVSALLVNLSSCSDDPQDNTATVRTARVMLINFMIPCEYRMSS